VALPLLGLQAHAAVLWDAALTRHESVGPTATEASARPLSFYLLSLLSIGAI
jgi:hypothetical protein